MDSRCTRCTEPIDPSQLHVVVTRTVEHRVANEIHVAHAEEIAEFHAGECAPTAGELGELVSRGGVEPVALDA